MLPAWSDRFWSRVSKDGPICYQHLGPCWVWLGQPRSNGYGGFYVQAEGIDKAHRASWILAYGPIPDGLHVLHHCDNRICVRPDHLWLGTNLDNIADMASKGRAGRRKGGGVKTHCSRGHVLLLGNDGRRRCKECHREGAVRRNHAKRAANPIPMKPNCPQGHPYSGENLFFSNLGHRLCRTCNRARAANYQRRRRANAK